MNGKNTLGTSNPTFTDYLNQTRDQIHKDVIPGKVLTRRTPNEWNKNFTGKDMNRINRSEHMVELGCLSYW